MQGIEAGGHLHALGHIDGIAVGHIDAGLLQRGPSVGEAVLHHQILRHLGVDKGRDIGVAAGDNGGHTLHAQRFQLFLNHLGGARGDLVDHAPGEADLLFVGDPVHIGGGRQPVVPPSGGDFQHALSQLFAVVATVVHADQGDGMGPRFKSRQHHGSYHAHGMTRLLRAVFQVLRHHGQQLALDVPKPVALFGDGEAGHLQGRAFKDRFQRLPVARVGAIGLEPVGDGGDDLLLRFAVRLEADHQRHGIVRHIDLIDDIVVKGLRRHDAALLQALVQKPLLQPGDKAAEDISRAKVHPNGFVAGMHAHGRPVKAGKRNAGLLPCIGVADPLIGKFHGQSEPPLAARRSLPPARTGTGGTPRVTAFRWPPTGR